MLVGPANYSLPWTKNDSGAPEKLEYLLLLRFHEPLVLATQSVDLAALQLDMA